MLALGVFYVVVLAAYLLFEQYPVNVRPVLVNGCCEASYPLNNAAGAKRGANGNAAAKGLNFK